jgi:hypothetical protein
VAEERAAAPPGMNSAAEKLRYELGGGPAIVVVVVGCMLRTVDAFGAVGELAKMSLIRCAET